jgi:hypothetical protein
MSELWFDQRLFVERTIAMSKDAPGMRGHRSRNVDGELRQKRSDTHVGTVESAYGRDFGVRSDMELGNLLRREGVDSLSDLLRRKP